MKKEFKPKLLLDDDFKDDFVKDEFADDNDFAKEPFDDEKELFYRDPKAVAKEAEEPTWEDDEMVGWSP